MLDISQIWTEYGSRLRGFLSSRLANDADVEDVLQEILLKTHRRAHTVLDPEKLGAWLFQVARNALVDHLRKRTDEASPDADDVEVLLPEGAEKIRGELARCIRPFLADLPEAYREAVEAVDLEGRSQKALAEELGLSHSAIKSRVQRGRRLLAERFQQCCRFEVDARGNVLDYESRGEGCPARDGC